MRFIYKLLIIIIIFLYIPAYSWSESLTLEESIKIGIKNNFDIRIAETEKKIAAYNLKSVKSLLYPQLSASANYNKMEDKGAGSSGIGADGENMGFNISAGYEIYSFGKRKNNIDIAEVNKELSIIEKQNQINNLVYNIKKVFIR
jgi:outer membrane protein TolC